MPFKWLKPLSPCPSDYWQAGFPPRLASQSFSHFSPYVPSRSSSMLSKNRHQLGTVYDGYPDEAVSFLSCQLQRGRTVFANGDYSHGFTEAVSRHNFNFCKRTLTPPGTCAQHGKYFHFFFCHDHASYFTHDNQAIKA